MFKVFPMIRQNNQTLHKNGQPTPHSFATMEESDNFALDYLGAVSWFEVNLERTPTALLFVYEDRAVYFEED